MLKHSLLKHNLLQPLNLKRGFINYGNGIAFDGAGWYSFGKKFAQVVVIFGVNIVSL